MKVPPTCGQCPHLKREPFGGTILSMCGHRGGPDKDGKPGFVTLNGPPFEWCPLRNGLTNKIFQVIKGKLGALK